MDDDHIISKLNDYMGGYVKSTIVSVAEGKRGFSRLIQDALERKRGDRCYQRGKPVAVILPYEEYQQSKRVEGYRKISRARQVFLENRE